jgi:hypothetical protein
MAANKKTAVIRKRFLILLSFDYGVLEIGILATVRPPGVIVVDDEGSTE